MQNKVNYNTGKINIIRLLTVFLWLLFSTVSIRGWMRLSALRPDDPPIWNTYTFADQLYGSWLFFTVIATGLIILYLLEIYSLKQERLKSILFWVAAMSAASLLVYPLGSPDLFGNVAFARVYGYYGFNPYQAPVADINNFLSDLYLKNSITGSGVTPYGPIWTWLSYIIYKGLQNTGFIIVILGFKLAGLLTHLFITLLIYHTAEAVARGRGAQAALLYGMNPLAIFEFIANGHNDSLGILLLIFALFLFLKGKRFIWPVILGLAAATKITTLLLVPFIMWKLLKSRKLIHTFISIGLMAAVLFIVYYPFSYGGDPFFGIKNASGGIYTNTLPVILFNMGFKQMPVSVRIGSIIIFICSYAYLLKRSGNGNYSTLFIGIGLSFITYFLTVATAVHQWYYLWPLALMVLVPASPWTKLIVYQTLLLLLSYIIKINFWPVSTIYGPYTYLISLAPVIVFLIINYRYITGYVKEEL